jgi:hypothetical protein
MPFLQGKVRILCVQVSPLHRLTGTCMDCVTHAGVDMSCTDFEKAGGKGASKKWKISVRVLVDGQPGPTVDSWLKVGMCASLSTCYHTSWANRACPHAIAGDSILAS